MSKYLCGVHTVLDTFVRLSTPRSPCQDPSQDTDPSSPCQDTDPSSPCRDTDPRSPCEDADPSVDTCRNAVLNWSEPKGLFHETIL